MQVAKGISYILKKKKKTLKKNSGWQVDPLTQMLPLTIEY